MENTVKHTMDNIIMENAISNIWGLVDELCTSSP